MGMRLNARWRPIPLLIVAVLLGTGSGLITKTSANIGITQQVVKKVETGGAPTSCLYALNAHDAMFQVFIKYADTTNNALRAASSMDLKTLIKTGRKVRGLYEEMGRLIDPLAKFSAECRDEGVNANTNS